MASLDWSQCLAVESVPGKLGGAWVLKGTRMPVSAIFENIEAGANIDDIMEWFDGLDREQVKAVIEFAARSLDKPPVLLLDTGFVGSGRRPFPSGSLWKATPSALLRTKDGTVFKTASYSTPPKPLGSMCS